MVSKTRGRMTSAFIALSVGAVVLCACGVGASQAMSTTTVPHATSGPLSPGDHYVSLTVGGVARDLLVHVPPGAATTKRPLILVYHGANDTAKSTEHETDFDQVADANDQVVAFMQGYKNTWNEGAGHTPAEQAGIDDVAYTKAAIAALGPLVAYNHAKIAAVGFSNGALMVQYLGCQIAGKLVLIVPVEGELPVSVSKTCAPTRAVGVYEIHGTADATIPYNGGPFSGVGGGTTVLSAPKSVARWAHLDACSMNVVVTHPSSSIKLTTYSKCHLARRSVLRTIIGGQHVWGSNIALLVTAALPT